MSKNEMISKIEELQEIEAFIEEIKDEAEAVLSVHRKLLLTPRHQAH